MKLSDGREIEINLYKVTRKEYRDFCDPKGHLDKEDLFISKATGLTLAEVESLPVEDFNDIVRSVFNVRKKKTLASEPTSPT